MATENLNMPRAEVGGAPGPGRRLRPLLGPRLVLALVAGIAVGAASEGLVLRASFSILPLTNSAAPWVLVAFAVALTARRTDEAVLLAVVALLAMVLGFYVAQSTRGWEVSRHQAAFWTLTSFVAGPLIGLAADWLERRGPLLAGLGAGIIGGVLAGEAVHGLREYDFLTPHTYWRVQLVVGLALTVGLTLWRGRRDPPAVAPALAVAFGSCAAVGLATLFVYQVA